MNRIGETAPPRAAGAPALVVGALLLLAVACAGPPTATDVVLTPSPNQNAPLAATVTFTTDAPAVATLAIDDGETVTEVTPSEEAVTEHDLLVLGLLPDTEHTVTVTIRNDGGETVLEPLTLTTPPLPDDFPPISVPLRKPQQMEPGYTLVPLFRWTEEPGKDDKEWGLVFATDAEGRVRWYLRTDHSLGEVRRLRNGNLFYGGGRGGGLIEVDMLGNVVHTLYPRLTRTEHRIEGAQQVETDTFHHDIIELPNGNFAALSTEARWFEDYPSEYPPGTKTEDSHVIGDVLVEFTREGELVREHKMLDVLDPYRLGYGSLETDFYEDEYEGVLEKPGRDLMHSNALYYLEDRNAMLVSSNMQSVHYLVDWETGELIWLLGDPDGWKSPWNEKLLQPKGEVKWAYHHHGIEPSPNGFLLFDNGGGRTLPPKPPIPEEERYSRAVEYAVDEGEWTVEQVWEYGPEQEWFMSPFISDADWLPETGNVLITDGGRMVGPDGEQLRRFGGRNWARVIEVTYGDDPEKVWELIVDDPGRGYSIYRAQRIRSLYPSLDRPTG